MKAFALNPSALLIRLKEWMLMSMVTTCALGLLGLILRFTIRDEGHRFIGVLFLALPLPVCAAAFFGSGLLGLLLAKKKWLVTQMIASFICGVLWLANSFVWQGEAISAKQANELRAGFWNTADNPTAFTSTSQLIDTNELEIMCFAELNAENYGNDPDVFRMIYPDWQLFFLGSLGIAAKGEVELVKLEKGDQKFLMHLYKVTLTNQPATPFHVAMIDMGPHPLYRRAPNLEHALAQLTAYQDNLLIMGDFNTPYESVGLDGFRERYQHCFTCAGRGLRETWPWPIPALSLDHLWVSKNLQPQICRKIKRWSSDHAMVWAGVKLK